MGKKTDLLDVTFLIPVRIDSIDRMENLELVLSYLKTHFDTRIMVLEADKKEKVKSPLIDTKLFIQDENPIFHRTKYLNHLTKTTTTPIIAVWDTDVIMDPQQIINAANLLRREEANIAYPYDGHFYNTPDLIKKLYRVKEDLNVFKQNEGKFRLAFGNHSVGGAFMANRESYIKAGMENENFFGWGPEDLERMKRFEILGYQIKRVNGPLFHLFHSRGINSGFTNISNSLKMKKELIRICSISREQLQKEVSIWDN